MSVILATGGYDHKIRFWEAPSGICSRTLRFPDSQVNCLEITPDKQFLAAGGNPHIRLFDINNGANHTPVLSCDGHTSSVTSLGFQQDGRWMFSGSEDGTVKIFDLRSPTYQRSFDSRGPVRSVALHPNQTELVSGDQNGSVKIWDLRSSSNKCVNDVVPDASPPPPSSAASTSTSPNKRPPSSSQCSPSSTSSSSSATAVADAAAAARAAAHARVAIQAVDASDRIIVAANARGEVFVWGHSSSSDEGGTSSTCTSSVAPVSTSNLKPIARFQSHPPGSYCLRAKISPDCQHLVTTGSDRTARLWDTTTWELTQTLAQHQRWVWDAVFSADSSYLVTASSDHSARLWNLRTGEVVRQYNGHQSAVTCVALNDSST